MYTHKHIYIYIYIYIYTYTHTPSHAAHSHMMTRLWLIVTSRSVSFSRVGEIGERSEKTTRSVSSWLRLGDNSWGSYWVQDRD